MSKINKLKKFVLECVKNKYVWFILIVISILIVVMISLINTREVWVPITQNADYDELSIREGVPIKQTVAIDTTVGSIHAIDVLMLLNDIEKPSSIQAAVLDGNNNVIGEALIKFTSIQTYGDYVRIPIYETPDNETLQIILTPEQVTDLPVSIYCSDEPETLTPLYNGETHVGGTLVARVVYLKRIQISLVFFLIAIIMVLAGIYSYFFLIRKPLINPAIPDSQEKQFNIRALLFFAMTALLFGALMAVINPVMDTPDEPAHFSRAYYVSTGHFANPVTGDFSGVPDSLREAYLHARTESLGIADAMHMFSAPVADTAQTRQDDLAGTGNYSFICYFPQALGLFFCRMLNLPIWMYFYIPRLFSLLAYILIIGAAIFISPCYKNVIAAISLLPMSLFLASSCSQDGLGLAFFILFIALYLKAKFNDKKNVQDIIYLSVLLLVLIVSKIVFCCFALLLLTLDYKPLKKNYLKYAAFCGLAVFTIAYYVTIVIHTQQAAYYFLGGVRDPEAQLKYIMSSPLNFLYTIVAHYLENIPGYAQQLSTFGWLSYNTGIFITLTPIFISFVLLVCSGEKRVKIGTKLTVVLAVISNIVLITMALYLSWSPVGTNKIFGIQGRYLYHLLVLLPLLFSNSFIKMNKDTVLNITISFAPVMLAYTLMTMVLHYY